mmetsp:Transcript_41119/g.92846  ORF Transcript_41119/g.92846 Transcript_41119/m.92846 type:complete len:334 (-) Transcript_41119:817-1818(-)
MCARQHSKPKMNDSLPSMSRIQPRRERDFRVSVFAHVASTFHISPVRESRILNSGRSMASLALAASPDDANRTKPKHFDPPSLWRITVAHCTSNPQPSKNNFRILESADSGSLLTRRVVPAPTVAERSVDVAGVLPRAAGACAAPAVFVIVFAWVQAGEGSKSVVCLGSAAAHILLTRRVVLETVVVGARRSEPAVTGALPIAVWGVVCEVVPVRSALLEADEDGRSEGNWAGTGALHAKTGKVHAGSSAAGSSSDSAASTSANKAGGAELDRVKITRVENTSSHSSSSALDHSTQLSEIGTSVAGSVSSHSLPDCAVLSTTGAALPAIIEPA